MPHSPPDQDSMPRCNLTCQAFYAADVRWQQQHLDVLGLLDCESWLEEAAMERPWIWRVAKEAVASLELLQFSLLKKKRKYGISRTR